MFNDPNMFVGMNGLLMEEESQVLLKPLPPQRPITGAEAAFANALDTTTSAGKAVFAGNVFFNLVM